MDRFIVGLLGLGLISGLTGCQNKSVENGNPTPPTSDASKTPSADPVRPSHARTQQLLTADAGSCFEVNGNYYADHFDAFFQFKTTRSGSGRFEYEMVNPVWNSDPNTKYEFTSGFGCQSAGLYACTEVQCDSDGMTFKLKDGTDGHEFFRTKIAWTQPGVTTDLKLIDSDGYTFGYMTKAAFDKIPADAECGLEQKSIPERIKDCAKLSGATRIMTHHPACFSAGGCAWNLVARRRDDSSGEDKFYEVWLDAKSSLIWSDTLDSTYKYSDAIKINQSDHKDIVLHEDEGDAYLLEYEVKRENACDSDEAERAFANIEEVKFRMPKLGDYELAYDHGIRRTLPEMNSKLFLTTAQGNEFDTPIGYAGMGYANASRGYVSPSTTVYYIKDENTDFSVRCVGEYHLLSNMR